MLKESDYQVIGGLLSPVADSYCKKGLAPAADRIEMCLLATEDSDWITVDAWEARRDEWTPTAKVLSSLEMRLQEHFGTPVRAMLLAGGDLVQSFMQPNLWDKEDVRTMWKTYGSSWILFWGITG